MTGLEKKLIASLGLSSSITAVSAQTIALTLAGGEPIHPEGYSTFGYRIILTQNNGPESSVFVPQSQVTNRIGRYSFTDLEQNSAYTFRATTIAINSEGNYEESDSTPTISYVTGAINKEDKTPPVISSLSYPNISYRSVIIRGSARDESHIKSLNTSGDIEIITRRTAGNLDWELYANLPKPETNAIIITAEDYNGNKSSTNIYILNLESQDSDGDGLKDLYEKHISKTSPDSKDTDNDGTNDDVEILYQLNPLDANSNLGIRELKIDDKSLIFKVPVRYEWPLSIEASTNLINWWIKKKIYPEKTGLEKVVLELENEDSYFRINYSFDY